MDEVVKIKKHMLPVTMILLTLLLWIFLWDSLPNPMPIHWDANGEINGLASKSVAFIVMNGLMIGAYVPSLLQSRMSGSTSDDELIKSDGRITNLVMTILFLANVGMLLETTGHNFDMSSFASVVIVSVGIMFIVVGVNMPKKKPSVFASFGRMPKPILQEKVWTKTRKLAGRLYIIAGAVTIISAMMTTTFTSYVAVAAIFVATLVPVIYSRIMYKKITKNKG